MSNRLEMRTLFGDPFVPKNEVGAWLLECRQTRALRAWIRPGAYAWWIMGDQLKAQQRRLLEIRRLRAKEDAAAP